VKTDLAVKQEKQSMTARTQYAIPVLTAIGVDIGKDIFHIVGFGADGKIALRRRVKRLALAETFKKLPPWVRIKFSALDRPPSVSSLLKNAGN
jgi:hypothetical protein